MSLPCLWQSDEPCEKEQKAVWMCGCSQLDLYFPGLYSFPTDVSWNFTLTDIHAWPNMLSCTVMFLHEMTFSRTFQSYFVIARMQLSHTALPQPVFFVKSHLKLWQESHCRAKAAEIPAADFLTIKLITLRQTLFIHYHPRGVCTILQAFIPLARSCSIMSDFAQNTSKQPQKSQYGCVLCFHWRVC